MYLNKSLDKYTLYMCSIFTGHYERETSGLLSVEETATKSVRTTVMYNKQIPPNIRIKRANKLENK